MVPQTSGHFMDQFWSPTTNSLDAAYGVDLTIRLRLTLEVLQAVRGQAGAEFIIGMRYTADEVHKQGLTAEDGIEISKLLRDGGMVDFLNVIRGRINDDSALTFGSSNLVC